MSRGLKALEVLLETIDGYEHDWNEIDIAKETIKLELRWLDGYSEQLAKREEQLDKIRKLVERKLYYNTLNCELFIDKILYILEKE